MVTTVVGSGKMATNLSGDVGIQLLINSIATAFVLFVIITMFAPISGAQFNPVVTITEFLNKRIEGKLATGYVLTQFIGAIMGVIAANLMFDQPAISAATKFRTGSNLFLSEIIATAGLILIINLMILQKKQNFIPGLVALWIGAGYFFTSSTSFANPAVTIARSLTDTFTGINFESVPPFIIAQLIGAVIGLLIAKILQPESRNHD